MAYPYPYNNPPEFMDELTKRLTEITLESTTPKHAYDLLSVFIIKHAAPHEVQNMLNDPLKELKRPDDLG